MEKHVLTDEQIEFLTYIGAHPDFAEHFYLTGGTPLAEFYLHHRYSEDLDFFSPDPVDATAVQTFWHDAKAALHIKKIDFQQSYNRNLFFLHTARGILKTEFTYFPFPRMERGSSQYGIAVDSMLDIAVNKLFTIYQRTHARDYIDLYCLCEKGNYTIAELVTYAKAKFDWHIDPIQLGTQFVKAEEAEDMPRMIIALDPKEWRAFFVQQAESLHDEIFV